MVVKTLIPPTVMDTQEVRHRRLRGGRGSWGRGGAWSSGEGWVPSPSEGLGVPEGLGTARRGIRQACWRKWLRLQRHGGRSWGPGMSTHGVPEGRRGEHGRALGVGCEGGWGFLCDKGQWNMDFCLEKPEVHVLGRCGEFHTELSME